jgi:hypothetical protein
MPLSRDDLTRQLADLEAAVPGLVQEHDDEALEAIACMGDDLASQAGPERCWVEDQVEAILLRHGLIEA